MSAPVKPIPDGYHTLTPYLIVHDGVAALDYYARAFGAVELMRMPAPGGKIGHSEMRIGDSVFMLADENASVGALGPKTLGGTGVHLLLYMENVDAVVPRAVDAGGKLIRPLADQFYGDRTGTVEDPFGHSWTVATHVEDLTHEEIARRAKASGKE